MKYIKVDTQQVMSIYEIRKEHPNMSIPETANLEEFGYDAVHESTPPTPGNNEIITEGAPEKRSDGKYYVTYKVAPAPVQPEYVPHSISMGQARLALFDLGKLAAVTTAINSLPEMEKARAQIEWEYRTTVERQSPLVLQLGSALELDLDALFIAAAKL